MREMVSVAYLEPRNGEWWLATVSDGSWQWQRAGATERKALRFSVGLGWFVARDQSPFFYELHRPAER